MSLLRYFKPSSDTTKLPDPHGPLKLSTKVPSSSKSVDSIDDDGTFVDSYTEVKQAIETQESSVYTW